MNHTKYFIAIITILSLLVFSSCGHKHTEGDGHNHGAEESTHSEDDEHDHGGEEQHEEGLHLSKAQAKTIGLEFGTLSSIKVNDFVKATGSLGLPPNAHSSVSAKTNGIIKGTKKFVEGDYIKKGAVIAYLENADLIITQQDYLEAKAQLTLKGLEVERQNTLVESNAGVTKNLQNAQAEVAVLDAKTQGLAKQLSFLGISTSNLSPSTIKQQIAIVAPMSGYISKINFHNGMYAQSSISLMDIISSEHLHLELDVFEKDIANIKKGQKISYTVPALGQSVYYGSVEVIGKEFNANSKTIRVHGHLEGTKPTFLKDLFINAKIYLNNEESSALPEEAIIKDGANSFIYVANEKVDDKEIEFEKIAVVTGATDNGFTAVKLIDTIPDGMQIVTKGAYYVYAQSKAGELEHEH
ncbi:MAG: Cobalt-zinc-cadmium resistance protein CzcB [Bacteroidia bacterium]|jgi:cobalt-zinc-cadmium efflux system membrane fusion protein|nr:efflux RND transporter periplasmic adaptor subunit [Flavobacteriaceae bacterium]CAI8235631.1 MAG: Cobalt-zinc-cadmium resistance protein CzcB [Bacteroidia bacterium]